MKTTKFMTAIGISVLLVSTAIADPSQAFRNFAVGDTLPRAKLRTLDGKKAELVDSSKAVSVFFFFRPDQENSQIVLKQIAECQTRLKDQQVHWVGVVSDHYSQAESVAVVAESGLKAPIMVDKGDALYGQLGVSLHPVVAVADKKRVLKAYEPFRKINYCVVMEARIRHALGNIDDKQLELALNPPKATQGGDEAKAVRNLKFAEMLLKAKKPDKAMALVDKALKMSPDLAAAHALKGEIQAEQGDCKAALAEFEKALAADATDARAKAGKTKCGGSAAVPSESPTNTVGFNRVIESRNVGRVHASSLPQSVADLAGACRPVLA